MKNLIIARHGDFDRQTGDLNDFGKDQVAQLAVIIRSLTEGHTIGILSSTCPRALQSSNIVGEILGVTPENCELIWSGIRSPNGTKTQLDKVLAEIVKSTVDTLILVTHQEYSQDLPNYFGHQVLGVTNFPTRSTLKGAAWFIDLMKKAALPFRVWLRITKPRNGIARFFYCVTSLDIYHHLFSNRPYLPCQNLSYLLVSSTY